MDICKFIGIQLIRDKNKKPIKIIAKYSNLLKYLPILHHWMESIVGEKNHIYSFLARNTHREEINYSTLNVHLNLLKIKLTGNIAELH